jgi:hypothetical protein
MFSQCVDCKLVETKWHCTVLDLIMILNGTFVLPQTVDGGKQGWCSSEGFPLKLHRELLFQGFLGCGTKVAVHRGVLYQSLFVCFMWIYNSKNPVITYSFYSILLCNVFFVC